MYFHFGDLRESLNLDVERLNIYFLFETYLFKI
jgi:hypothetical protein